MGGHCLPLKFFGVLHDFSTSNAIGFTLFGTVCWLAAVNVLDTSLLLLLFNVKLVAFFLVAAHVGIGCLCVRVCASFFEKMRRIM